VLLKQLLQLSRSFRIGLRRDSERCISSRHRGRRQCSSSSSM
jgi:hypothetical protein